MVVRPPAMVSTSSEAARPTWNRRARCGAGTDDGLLGAGRLGGAGQLGGAEAVLHAGQVSGDPLGHRAGVPRAVLGLGARQSLAMSTRSASAPQASSRARASAVSPSAAFSRISAEERPRNAGPPVRTSARIEPSAKTSARSSTRLTSPRACSGAM